MEHIRRRVLDVFRSWGFEYVDPPVIEYLDSLLVGTGPDMDLQTLKVVDQRSGRLLGVRADMTSQAARIDAHSLAGEGVRRLCYAGSVVHANPAAVLDTRVPFKAGAEIFGAETLAADAEVIALMLDVLRSAGVDRPVLVLGHMGIYRGLIEPMSLPPEEEQALFSAVQSKSETDIAEVLGGRPGHDMAVQLPTLMGRHGVLAEARSALSAAPPAVGRALDALEHLADLVAARCPGLELRFDVAELAGYGYHNGAVFSAYQADRGSALARGGRYDGIGAAFGRARPATGFDVSLKQLLSRGGGSESAVWVPWLEHDAQVAGDARRRRLLETLERLRAAGEIIVCAVTEQEQAPARCDRILIEADGMWTVRPLT